MLSQHKWLLGIDYSNEQDISLLGLVEVSSASDWFTQTHNGWRFWYTVCDHHKSWCVTGLSGLFNSQWAITWNTSGSLWVPIAGKLLWSITSIDLLPWDETNKGLESFNLFQDAVAVFLVISLLFSNSLKEYFFTFCSVTSHTFWSMEQYCFSLVTCRYHSPTHQLQDNSSLPFDGISTNLGFIQWATVCQR